jgi:hypothetical protein
MEKLFQVRNYLVNKSRSTHLARLCYVMYKIGIRRPSDRLRLNGTVWPCPAKGWPTVSARTGTFLLLETSSLDKDSESGIGNCNPALSGSSPEWRPETSLASQSPLRPTWGKCFFSFWNLKAQYFMLVKVGLGVPWMLIKHCQYLTEWLFGRLCDTRLNFT